MNRRLQSSLVASVRSFGLSGANLYNKALGGPSPLTRPYSQMRS